MTLSDSQRLAAIDVALSRMLAELGDRVCSSTRFSARTELFHDLPQTTWLELEAFGHVEAVHAIGDPAYRFTPAGWLAALNATQKFDSPDVRERAVSLRAALKDAVKGRPLEGGFTDYHRVHGSTRLPIEWIMNAIASRLLQHLWLDDHLDVEVLHGGRSIRVPGRFGAKRLLYSAGPFPDP